ncbi:MAG TPA: DUF2142 domain-containing protein [Ilumatobacteraceae bacterium]
MRVTAFRGAAGYMLALIIVVATWAVGMPRFASPDEPAHVYKAYGTAHGQLLGDPAPGFPDNLREFDGPDSLGPPNLNCFVQQPDVPASCATEVSPRLISSAARYPPWYYGLVGAPVAISGQSASVRAYRLVSSAFCAALLTLAMLLAKRSPRRDLAPLQLVVLTPMALFLMASVNPNAMEVAALVAVWACLTRVVSDDEIQIRWWILASILAAVVVLIRPISIVWLVCIVAVVLIGTSPARLRQLFTRRMLAWAILPTLLAAVASVLWNAYSQFEVSDDRVQTPFTLAGALRKSIDNWPIYFKQTIGVLGWLDTTLPFFVYVALIIAVAIVVLIHLRSASARGVVALAALVVAWLALPLLINGFTNTRAGLSFQGRYALGLFAGLAFLPMWNRRGPIRWPRLSQQWLVESALVLVVVGEVGAFWQMLRRFAVGQDGKVLLTGNLSWQPSVTPMLLIALNAVAMIALGMCALLSWDQAGALVEDQPSERSGRSKLQPVNGTVTARSMARADAARPAEG